MLRVHQLQLLLGPGLCRIVQLEQFSQLRLGEVPVTSGLCQTLSCVIQAELRPSSFGSYDVLNLFIFPCRDDKKPQF